MVKDLECRSLEFEGYEFKAFGCFDSYPPLFPFLACRVQWGLQIKPAAFHDGNAVTVPAIREKSKLQPSTFQTFIGARTWSRASWSWTVLLNPICPSNKDYLRTSDVCGASAGSPVFEFRV